MHSHFGQIKANSVNEELGPFHSVRFHGQEFIFFFFFQRLFAVMINVEDLLHEHLHELEDIGHWDFILQSDHNVKLS
jgi:hypothetical protein